MTSLDDGDFWIALDAPERYAGLVAAGSAPAVLHEPNRLAFERYGRRLASGHLLRSLDSMLAASVATPGGSLVLAPFPYYELGQLLADVLAAPGLGVARPELAGWLASRRLAFYAARPRPSWRERAMRRFWASVIPGALALPRGIAAVYAAAAAKPLFATSTGQSANS